MAGEVEVRRLPPQPVLVARRRVSLATVAAGMDSAFGELWSHLTETGVTATGPPMVLYPEPPTGDFDIDVCVPVPAEAVAGEGVERWDLPGTEAAVLVHQGPYDGLGSSWQVLTQWVAESSRVPAGPAREVYVTDPRTCAPDELRTELVMPLA